MGTVLSGIADGEVIEGGGHDPDAFVGVAAADEDEAELEAAFQVFFDVVVCSDVPVPVFGSVIGAICWRAKACAF